MSYGRKIAVIGPSYVESLVTVVVGPSELRNGTAGAAAVGDGADLVFDVQSQIEAIGLGAVTTLRAGA